MSGNLNEVTSEVASVYMEIGMQVGVKLMMEMVANVNRGGAKKAE